jgi:hypothetical protein
MFPYPTRLQKQKIPSLSIKRVFKCPISGRNMTDRTVQLSARQQSRLAVACKKCRSLLLLICALLSQKNLNNFVVGFYVS